MYKFKKSDGTYINDYISYVKKWVENNPNSELFIGCDSQDKKYETSYSIAIVMYNKGHGGHVITANIKKNGSIPRLNRLWEETVIAVDIAKPIKEALPLSDITIHLDYNPNNTYISNIYFNTGIGYAESIGVKAEGKPLAPAASYAADRECRK